MTVVQINVSDPLNGPKIFDSLNSAQEPMTTGDLVRNEIFSKVADRHPDEIEKIDQHNWQPFYRMFQQGAHNIFDQYFFPYGLIRDPNVRKSEVYASLKKAWQDVDDPTQIIKELGSYQNAFIDLVSGTNHQKHSPAIHQLLMNLKYAGAPGSTFPFLMQLSNAIANKAITEQNGIELLAVIESFLVRRAICGHEPTGLHAVFKRLWVDCSSKPTKDLVKAKIRDHRTVVWPESADVKKSIKSRPLFGVGVTKYLLLEYDRSLGGDQPQDVPWIEHILPNKPKGPWFRAFTTQDHDKLKDLLGNLIPLSKEMNIDLSNDVFEVKKKSYKEDSMFKSARKVAHENSKWNPTSIRKRCDLLADWAAERWQY